MSDEYISSTALVLSATVFLTCLPRPGEIRDCSPHDAAHIRSSVVIAAGITVAGGIGLTALSGTTTPATVAIITSMAFVALAELLIRSQPTVHAHYEKETD